MSGNDITFSNNINSSLQIGDTLYFETPSETLGDNILDVNEVSNMTNDTSGVSGPLPNGALTGFDNDGFTIVNSTTIDWLPTTYTPVGINYFNNVTTENLVIGETYHGTLEISGYSGTGELGISTQGGVSSNLRLSGDGTVSDYFVATGSGKPDLFVKSTNQGTITATIRKVISGNVFGFSRIESDQLQKCGVVTSLTNNTVTVDGSGTLPSARDYIMFAKNHTVNTSSLSGYYADVKFKNNSIEKAELFATSSEVTESSK